MSSQFFIRTEDIKQEDLMDIYVETKEDRKNINYLKSMQPVLLLGSRGTGKTMLMRVAEKEMDNEFENERVLSVFVRFNDALLVRNGERGIYFRQWMISKILYALKIKLREKGLLVTADDSKIFNRYFNIDRSKETLENKLEEMINLFQRSWQFQDDELLEKLNEVLGQNIQSIGALNEIDYLKTLIKDICRVCDIDKIVLLFDEACHVFMPLQQRHFFTLFRDIRSPYITCKAAVYPGITSYGTFEKFHDAIERRVERDINDPNYVEKMREIVRKQVSEDKYKIFENNGKNFDALIYSSSGNPRLLLKSLSQASNNLRSLRTSDVNSTIKDFYRTDIWKKHSQLAEDYKGYKELVDWGRNFIENTVVEDISEKNDTWGKKDNPKQTIYFTIHRDAPEFIKRAIKILEYSGIVMLHTEGIKERGEVYNRYEINLGIILSSSKSPVEKSKELMDNLSIKLHKDYGMNSPSYGEIKDIKSLDLNININEVLKDKLKTPIDKLDITDFQKEKLKKIGIKTLGKILESDEEKLQEANWIGPKRSRRISNVAVNAALEYIAG